MQRFWNKVSGDHPTNMRDMKVKGRANGGGTLGSANGSAKLTEEKVKKMRQARQDGLSYRQIAEDMGISVGAAHNAINKKNWKQI